MWKTLNEQRGGERERGWKGKGSGRKEEGEVNKCKKYVMRGRQKELSLKIPMH